MISILEPLCHGPEHAPVNAGLVQVVRRSFPDEPIAFYGSASHIAEVEAGLPSTDAQSITWCAVDLPPRTTGLRERWRPDFTLLRRVVVENARAGRHGHVLALQSTPSVLLAATALRAAGPARQPIHAVLHGYLNEAFGWRSRNPLRRAFDMRSALSLAASRVHLIALEPGIAEAVGRQMPRVGASIATLRHPLPVTQDDSMASAATAAGAVPALPIRFGFLGLATHAKGFDAFMNAARVLKPKYGDAVEFHALGRLPPDGKWDMEELQSCLATLPASSPVPRHRFDDEIARWHYVCLPYRTDHYVLSASGVLLDALAHLKPIVASATPAVREMFATANPGILLDDPEQLEKVVDRLIRTFNEADYREQVEQMRRVRAQRSPERLAQDYRRIIAGSDAR